MPASLIFTFLLELFLRVSPCRNFRYGWPVRHGLVEKTGVGCRGRGDGVLGSVKTRG